MPEETEEPQTTETPVESPHDDPSQVQSAAEVTEEAKGEEASAAGDGETTTEEATALSEDEVASLLDKDPRFRERILASDDVQNDLDAAIDSILQEKETQRDTQVKQAQSDRTMADAAKAYNEGDKEAWADYSFNYIRQQRAQALADERHEVAVSEAEGQANERINEMLREEYGSEIEALSNDKAAVARLDRAPDAPTFYRELRTTLRQMRSSAGDATTNDQVEEMSRAAANTATAAKARGDASVGVLPGGSAKEGAADSTDVNALIRDGLKGTPGLEDYG